MRSKKITMVNSEQIAARGWKGMKTRKGVESFTIKQHVNHVYWRQTPKRKILLVDKEHFQELWQNYKYEYKTTTFRPSAKKPVSSRNTPTTRKYTARKTSTTRRRTFKPVARKRTTHNRPNPRTQVRARSYTYR
ncbi:MAG: hypothetical protein KAY24_17440 [Candidatus Eisenbacteria sp.]|nr:hypothetical protein [Candidatus Eisenbacteria bacterium]